LITDIVAERIQARALNGYRELVEALGGVPEDLFALAGIEATSLHCEENSISLDSLALLYALSAKQLCVPDFGLRLSSVQGLSLYGPLALLLLNSPTVREALDVFIKYFSFHTPGAAIELSDADDARYVEVRYVLKLHESIDSVQIVEQSYGMACKLWRLLTGGPAGSYLVRLKHEARSPDKRYQECYACETLFAQSHNAIWLRKDMLEQPVRTWNPSLRSISEDYVATVIRHYPLNLSKQVETLINEYLEFGASSIDVIARSLGIHRRTLQRRLRADGMDFSSLLDEIRKRKALYYLQESALNVSMISGLLGYEEQSSFTRACKRWFDESPLRLRRSFISAG